MCLAIRSSRHPKLTRKRHVCQRRTQSPTQNSSPSRIPAPPGSPAVGNLAPQVKFGSSCASRAPRSRVISGSTGGRLSTGMMGMPRFHRLAAISFNVAAAPRHAGSGRASRGRQREARKLRAKGRTGYGQGDSDRRVDRGPKSIGLHVPHSSKLGAGVRGSTNGPG